jgi:hypothetical protein
VSEPAPLPDYVIADSSEPGPVVVPEPAPEPQLGPLPDYVVASEPSAADPPVRQVAQTPLVDEEEEDLGPLPDYVIDPARPAPEPTPQAPAPPAVEKPTPPSLEVAPDPEPDTSLSSSGLYFPPVTAFPTPREGDDDSVPPREQRRTTRRRPPVERGTTKRPTEAADPGDEGTEVSWMQGLSNRLSAYSLADDEAQESDGVADGPAVDDDRDSEN